MAVSRSIHSLGNGAALAPFGVRIRTAALVGGIVFTAALFGIATRPAGLLAAIWPANALLLGLLVRRPSLATPLGWFSAALGYVAADVLTGTAVMPAMLLMTGHLAGVATGFAFFMHRDQPDRRLRRPTSVLHLAVIVSLAAAASGAVGAIANPLLFGRTPVSGWTYWFATELVNYMILLPVVLTMPAFGWLGPERRRHAEPVSLRPGQIAPAAALLVACVASAVIGGPGAVAFPVPALLWCAVTYSQFGTAVLTLLFSIWTMVAIALGYIVDPLDFDTDYALMSVRIGVTLMALAPITVASVMVTRNELLDRLQQMASHDPLTGALNRRAFVEGFRARRDDRATRYRAISVLMLDIDHFKKINDSYGHAAGDQVLVTFARTVRECLRGTDLLGRFGGEEFAALMTGCTGDEAERVAERIRTAVAGIVVHLDGGRHVTMTVSIGLAAADQIPPVLEPLLSAADKALYAAKAGGRNRVALADAVATPVASRRASA